MTADTGDATARQARIAEARRLRAEDGLSKSQIAGRLGVSTGLLSQWLRGVDPPAWTKRPNAKDDLRERARELRRQHHSVPEIATELGIVKSTAYQWVRDLPLDADARKALFAREHSSTTGHGQMMAETRWSEYRAQRDRRRSEVTSTAGGALPPLSEAELLRLGALVYWCEGEKEKPWRQSGAVQFINSDVGLIRLFLSFLRVSGVEPDRIRYRVSIHENADAAEAVRWWADQIDVDCAAFQTPSLKRHRPKTVRYNTGAGYHGCLVVRVLRGRELYWQMHGMVAATLRELTLAARSVGVAWNDEGENGEPDV
jgi:transposase-like protein